ncbi:MAG: PSD1 and planctomycete cytochrome C domain-containing protein, partial [Planctomycetota bacterium]|nr:PSD1 and planctomycete cytochrome C domain-containing protein [Planctomycetota bacterium]
SNLLRRATDTIFVSAAIAMVFGSTVHAEEPAGGKIDFARQVIPILAGKCFACHGPDENQRQGELRLDVAERAHEKVIVPGSAAESPIIARITSTDAATMMPPPDSKLTLTPDEIATLTQWVNEGGDFRVHWAYQKLVRPEVPTTKRERWSRNDVDPFVLKTLEDNNLDPSDEADKVTLIRRLTLDLTGLPPTIAEVDAFLNDDRINAYERLVDRLLASQHYGERMAMEWLDLARYGDTNGYESDSDRAMWLYRNWVINAYNTNMPFDRFTVEQIAGDMLPHADKSQVIASGFNRNTTYNEESGSDPDEFRVVYAVERASTTGTVFLGLTLGCAQCHEHKYDPITQKEFYQFYSFFNNVDGELGATGHDIPLPPILSLPTKEQTQQLHSIRMEIDSVNEAIKAAVAQVSAASVAAEFPGPPALPVDADKEPKPEEVTHFAAQPDWEAYELKLATSRVPAEILELLKVDVATRTEEQRQKLHDYFVENAYATAKPIFDTLRTRRDELTLREAGVNKAIPTTMIMRDPEEKVPAFVLIRGDFLQKGDQVSPDVPAIFPPMGAEQPRNRLGLARWLIDPDHPLTARVAVNRLWKQFFGAGLVRTMEDFGVRGELPSHPDLLDWLATEFIRNGWDVKQIQKLIVMSAAYRQASIYRPDAAAIDPYNRLLAQQNRFRLTAEEIRDSALAVGGLLDDEIGGPSVFPYQPDGFYADKGRWSWKTSTGKDLYRRGLYTFWRRTTTYPTFAIFDAPTRETCTVDRPRTNTPLQALVTLNDPTFVEAARVFGERILRSAATTPEEKLTFAFRTALSRAPDDHEKQILLDLYRKESEKFTTHHEAASELVKHGEYRVPDDLDVVQLATWTALTNVVLNLDEMITRE